MRPSVRKYYRQLAAQASEQGWKSVGVDPTDLMALLRGLPSPPTESDLYREVLRLKDRLADAEVRLRQGARQVSDAYARGYGQAMKDQEC